MTEPQPNTDYPVFVAEHKGSYQLRIRELVLVVRGTDLRQAYEDLIKQKQEIIDSARTFGTLDDLPSPNLPMLLGADRSHSSAGFLSRLRTIWTRFL